MFHPFVLLQALFRCIAVVTLVTRKFRNNCFSTGESKVERLCSFFLRNSSLRLEFLLCVEGLVFFLNPELINSFPVVSKEKEKVWPMVREK